MPSRGDEQHAGGPSAAGIRVGVPGFGIAVVKEHEVQLSLMDRQLEEQGRSHPSSRRLEVSLSSRTEHGPLAPHGGSVVPAKKGRLHRKHEP